MEKYLHIRAEYDCVACVLGEEICLTQDIAQSYLINTDKDSVAIRVYPLSTNLLPFTFLLDLKGDHSSCEYCRVVDYGKGNLLINILPYFNIKIRGESKKKYATFGGKTHQITYNEYSPISIRLACDGKFIDIDYHKDMLWLDFVVSKDKVLIYCKLQNGYYVVIASYNNNGYDIEKSEEVYLLEKSKDEITTLQDMFCSTHHGRVTHYNIQQNLKNTTDIVYMDEENTPCTDKNLIPYLYMDAIKSKDIKLCRKYLSQKLNSVLDDRHILTFFGDYCYIDSPFLPSQTEHQISAIYKNANNTYYAKTYSFQINDNCQIENIEEE